MRDPIANLNVETAIDDAVKMLGSIRLGRFHEWEVVDESDRALRSEARIHIEVRTDWDMPEHIRRFLWTCSGNERHCHASEGATLRAPTGAAIPTS